MSKYKGTFGNIRLPDGWQSAAEAVKRADLSWGDERVIERVVNELSDRMYLAFMGIGEPEELTDVAEIVNAGLMEVKTWVVLLASGVWPYVAADMASGYGLEFDKNLRQWRRQH